MPEPVVIVGGGPAGLMAAEMISAAGVPVDIYEAMPTLGRKFLRAGIGGLNLTHAEANESFVARYGVEQETIRHWLADFGPTQLRDWAAGLGIETFVGSSGRVFPVGMKAAPLLRAWLQRLRQHGVRFHTRQRWLGWDDDGCLRFASPEGEQKVGSDDTALVLALGGGSWSRLGSDGAWVPLLAARGVYIAPLRPANCGFDVAWSEHLRQRFAGQPVKGVSACFRGQSRPGEFVISRHGVEGSLIYAFSAVLRDAIESDGQAILTLDLAPGRSPVRLQSDLQQPQGRDSLSNHLRRRAGIEGVKAALLHEVATTDQLRDPALLAALIKSVPITLLAPRPLDEAISTAGGVRLDALNADLMLKQLPGTFCAGEMLDWEAPTGGYLLTACLASGYRAGQGVLRWYHAKR
jgi:uncharacterized flavoprotein (TIGR03862 family)